MARWQHVPEWAARHPRVLRLSLPARAVYLSLWVACDRWGRGDADEWALRQALGVMDGTEVRPLLEELSSIPLDSGGVRLVTLYEVAGRSYWALPDYGRDGPSDVQRNRAASAFPDPPSHVVATCPDVSRRVETPRDESRSRTRAEQEQEQEREQEKTTQTRADARARDATLVPSSDGQGSGSGQGEGEGQAPPDPAIARAPATPRGWPNLDCERAGLAYLECQARFVKASYTANPVDVDAVQGVARSFPLVFPVAASSLVMLSAHKPECMTRGPVKWLLARCRRLDEDRLGPEMAGTGPARAPGRAAPTDMRSWRGAQAATLVALPADDDVF